MVQHGGKAAWGVGSGAARRNYTCKCHVALTVGSAGGGITIFLWPEVDIRRTYVTFDTGPLLFEIPIRPTIRLAYDFTNMRLSIKNAITLLRGHLTNRRFRHICCY